MAANSGLTDKRIIHGLIAYLCFRAMTGIYNRIWRKGEQLCGDTVHQHIKVSGWKVGPADGIPEQHIPCNDKSILLIVKTNVTIGMTGGKQYTERGGSP